MTPARPVVAEHPLAPATMGDMAGRPRGEVSARAAARLTRALAARDGAEREVRAAVIAALAEGASVREVAALTRLSTNTIQRWKAERDAR